MANALKYEFKNRQIDIPKITKKVSLKRGLYSVVVSFFEKMTKYAPNTIAAETYVIKFKRATLPWCHRIALCLKS